MFAIDVKISQTSENVSVSRPRPAVTGAGPGWCMTLSADSQGGVISSLSLVMQEEDTFTEELLEDVEGRIRDFFLGCFTKTEQEDSFESLVRDGKLYGQDYNNIKV